MQRRWRRCYPHAEHTWTLQKFKQPSRNEYLIISIRVAMSQWTAQKHQTFFCSIGKNGKKTIDATKRIRTNKRTKTISITTAVQRWTDNQITNNNDNDIIVISYKIHTYEILHPWGLHDHCAVRYSNDLPTIVVIRDYCLYNYYIMIVVARRRVRSVPRRRESVVRVSDASVPLPGRRTTQFRPARLRRPPPPPPPPLTTSSPTGRPFVSPSVGPSVRPKRSHSGRVARKNNVSGARAVSYSITIIIIIII